MTATRNARALVALLTVLLAATLVVATPLTADASTVRGTTAVNAAAAKIGAPYRWGGSGPNVFDCSGLTSFAWRRAGVSIPRTSRQQFASAPKVRSPRKGDLVAYGNPVHHVAVYAGGGKMIEAPRTGGKVRLTGVRKTGLRGYARPAR